MSNLYLETPANTCSVCNYAYRILERKKWDSHFSGKSISRKIFVKIHGKIKQFLQCWSNCKSVTCTNTATLTNRAWLEKSHHLFSNFLLDLFHKTIWIFLNLLCRKIKIGLWNKPKWQLGLNDAWKRKCTLF